MNKIIFYTLLLFIIRYFYSKYNLQLIKTDYDSKVKLLNNHIIYSNKPNIWILVPNDINCRKWESFGSRTSKKLNVPFVNICIDSIVKRCGNDFTINIIKDSSFSDFLPDWKYTVKHAPDIEKDKLRKLGLLKLVYYYGGLIVPCSDQYHLKLQIRVLIMIQIYFYQQLSFLVQKNTIILLKN